MYKIMFVCHGSKVTLTSKFPEFAKKTGTGKVNLQRFYKNHTR